jgi:beta-lactamase regulating signal transducer with metallopeptidase domain
MNLQAWIEWAFGIGLVATVHATVVGILSLLLAFRCANRSAALAHSIVMAGALCMLTLPPAIAAFRGRTLWSVPLMPSQVLAREDSSTTGEQPPQNSESEFPLPTAPNKPSETPPSQSSIANQDAKEQRLDAQELATSTTQLASASPASSTNSKSDTDPNGEVSPPGDAVAATSGLLPTDPPPAPFLMALTPLPSILLGIWMAGALMGGLHLMLALLYLRRLTRQAAPIPRGRAVNVLAAIASDYAVERAQLFASPAIDRPLLWGWRSPMILLPMNHEAWTDDDLEMVLQHELAHAARWDHRSRILLAAMRCIFWYHPIAWLLERWGGNLAEFAADDLCVSRGRSALSLGECLLRFASADPRSPSVSFASFRALRKRLKRLTFERPSSPQLQPVQRWLAPTVAIGFALILSFSVGISDYTNANESSENLAAIERLRTTATDVARSDCVDAFPTWLGAFAVGLGRTSPQPTSLGPRVQRRCPLGG